MQDHDALPVMVSYQLMPSWFPCYACMCGTNYEASQLDHTVIGKYVDVRTSVHVLACYAIDARVMLSGQYTQLHVTTKYSNN